MRGFDWSTRPDITARILEVYRGKLTKETTAIINREFGTSFEPSQIRGFLRNRGLKNGLGKSKKGVRYVWTQDKQDFLEARKDKSYDEILEDFVKEYGYMPTKGALGHIKWKQKIRSENDGKFKKGHMPTNGYEKGHIPSVYVPVGSETVRCGTIYVKVKDTMYASQTENWRPKSHLVWEAANGPVPEGHMIVFRDGDPMNLDLSNLELVTRGDNGVMNLRGYRFEGELFETGKLIAQVEQQTKKRSKEKT